MNSGPGQAAKNRSELWRLGIASAAGRCAGHSRPRMTCPMDQLGGAADFARTLWVICVEFSTSEQQNYIAPHLGPKTR